MHPRAHLAIFLRCSRPGAPAAAAAGAPSVRVVPNPSKSMARSVEVQSPAARVTLFGFKSVPAQVELVHRPTPVRLTRALLFLAGCWCAAPVLAILPPHVLWLLAAMGAGIYLGWKEWRGPYEVRRLETRCPSCGNALVVEPGARIALPHRISCFNCHHEPLLEAEVE